MESVKNQPVKTKREIAMERMRAKYPDKDFDNDEIFYGQIVEDYVDGEDAIAKYQANEKAISDMVTADPRAAQFLVDWRNGGNPMLSLIRLFGTDIKEALDDPERQEEIAAAQNDFLERVAKEQEYEKMYKDNLDKTLANIETAQAELGLNDDQVDAAMAFLQGIISDGVMGKFSTESIKMAHKAISHDADVAQAAHEGEVKGRNTKIEEKLRTDKRGDGVAALGSKNNNVKAPKTQQSFFDLARGAR